MPVEFGIEEKLFVDDDLAEVVEERGSPPTPSVANEGFAPLCGASATPVAALKTPVAPEGASLVFWVIWGVFGVQIDFFAGVWPSAVLALLVGAGTGESCPEINGDASSPSFGRFWDCFLYISLYFIASVIWRTRMRFLRFNTRR